MQNAFMKQLSALEQLSQEEFIASFEDHSLTPELFSHIGHIYITWLYLRKMPKEKAIEKVCVGIKSYANSLGATDKFHFTITDALVRIIYERLQQASAQSFALFIEQNNDLLENALSLLYIHFSPQLLESSKAQQSIVKPDRQGFN